MASSRRIAEFIVTKNGAEKRTSIRNAMYADVWVDTGGTAVPSQYKVIDISLGGAKLAIQEGPKLPDVFMIRVGSTSHTAHVVWRTHKHIGIEFVKPQIKLVVKD